MPGFVEYSKSAARQYVKEWLEMFARDCNHPSVVTWVLFENGFGINGPQCDGRPMLSVRDSVEVQEFVRETVGMVRAVDPHRLVIDNSGCLHLDTDIVDIHESASPPTELAKRIRTHWLGKRDNWIEGRELMVAGTEYSGQPIVLSDYGGLVFNETGNSNKEPCDTDTLLATYETFVKTIAKFRNICGRCYRQLTDVCSDMTGLATADRQSKVDCELLYQINRKYPKSK
ncbi:MAG: hypothetical protein J7M12_01645 [Candidatus Hydrogenedentes bacterium]|nr:hypothetical protein [Candidatus Hydrogenedentota bacterium]